MTRLGQRAKYGAVLPGQGLFMNLKTVPYKACRILSMNY